MLRRHVFTLFAAATLLFSCRPLPLNLYSFQRPLMHTLWDFSIAAPTELVAREAFEEASAEVERLDGMLAMWKADSELARFNLKAGESSQEVSSDLDEVLVLGQKISELSHGASDCTVGPLVQLWYENLKLGRLPKAREIEKARALMDYRRLDRTGARLWSLPAGARADLGSLAKGYAQDKVAALLRARGIHKFLINAGGQVYASGKKPDGKKWSVGVIHPRKPGSLLSIVNLENQAMSTSGDYEQSKIIQGRRYHHIIDPRSGWPVKNGVASATVILPLKNAQEPGAGSWCDALDTAALVLGRDEGIRLLEKQGASGFLIHADGSGKLSASVTKKLRKDLKLLLD